MFDMNTIMAKMQEVQAKMQEARANLVNITAQGEAGAGMVKVTINGNRIITNVEIDTDILKPDDQEMVQDLIVAATNKAIESIDVKIKEEMQKHTSGLVPNMPGFDLGNMM